MIIITHEDDSRVFHINTGDTFNLVVRSEISEETLISQSFTENAIITYYASFIFTDDKGRAIGTNICGFFGDKDNLPDEIKNATRLENLTYDQYANLIATCKLNLN